MKRVLLDEHLPHALRAELAGHDVYTVAYQKWVSYRNGVLMTAAEQAGFEVILTMDGGMTHQRPVTARNIAIILIEAPTNTIEDLRPLMPEILAAINAAEPGTLTVVR